MNNRVENAENSSKQQDNIALLQTNSQHDPALMLAQIEHALAALPSSIQFVATPENTLLMSHQADYRHYAQPENHQFIFKKLAELAKKFNVWLLLGSFPLVSQHDQTKLSNSSLLFNANGELVARYDKIHLFDADVSDQQNQYRESATFQGGNKIVVVDTPIGRLGMTICYDLRFPELFQALREKGAEVICVPAAFTFPTGNAHWEILLRARAIETQCHILAPAQYGWHQIPNSTARQTFGQSMLIDAWGNILNQGSISTSDTQNLPIEIVTGFIDLAAQSTIRHKMPRPTQSILRCRTAAQRNETLV